MFAGGDVGCCVTITIKNLTDAGISYAEYYILFILSEGPSRKIVSELFILTEVPLLCRCFA